MVKVKENKFEELLIKASQKANELNFKKLVLKSLRMEIKHKDDKEIESLYDMKIIDAIIKSAKNKSKKIKV